MATTWGSIWTSPAARGIVNVGWDEMIQENDLAKQAIQGYLASVSFSDAHAGRVLRALDGSPHRDNTIVLLLSDHGFHLGEKRSWTKATPWEEATDSLLMFRVPGVTRPEQVCTQPVSLLDIYPTLMDLTETKKPGHLDGRSLVPQLRDVEAPREGPAIMGYAGHLAVRTGDFRFIRYLDGSTELYDRRVDPNEWKNETDNPRYAEIKAELDAQLPPVDEVVPPLPRPVRGEKVPRKRRRARGARKGEAAEPPAKAESKSEHGRKRRRQKKDPAEEPATGSSRPNIIVILADDLGYGDLGCHGARDLATPNIDRMAEEGARFTSFYVASVCSPTRAAIMTGSMPSRVGIGGVMFPRHSHGLSPDEVTIAELLRDEGYATAIIGKWHLGNQDIFQPLNHGFESWYGTPASNSQFFDPRLKTYAEDCVWREGYTREAIRKMEKPAAPLIRDNVVIEVPADQALLTRRYTEETIALIEKHKKTNTPFFIYLAHNMPHIPLHASARFAGSSERGIYGDVIQELDWSTGEILGALKRLDLDDSTLVIFTSDNGPNLGAGGVALPLRGAKGSTYEGGVRVPFIARWPGKVPADVVRDDPITAMDLLPTLAHLAGAEVPDDRTIDGKDIWPLLSHQPGAKSPHEAIYYLRGRAIRVGDWKYRRDKDKPAKLTREQKKALRGKPKPERQAVVVEALYNLRDDIGERTNVIEEHPRVAARLRGMIDSYLDDLKASRRPAGQAEK